MLSEHQPHMVHALCDLNAAIERGALTAAEQTMLRMLGIAELVLATLDLLAEHAELLSLTRAPLRLQQLRMGRLATDLPVGPFLRRCERMALGTREGCMGPAAERVRCHGWFVTSGHCLRVAQAVMACEESVLSLMNFP